MSSVRNTIILGVTAVAVISVVAYYVYSSHSSTQSGQDLTITDDSDSGDNAPPVANSDRDTAELEQITFLKYEPYPFPAETNSVDMRKRIEQFRKLALSDQVDLINGGNLTISDKPFLLKIVTDKSLEPTTRNEAADLLRTPDFQDPDQWKLYAAMAEDASESIINRNYSIQYFANTYQFASDPAAVEQKLYEYSKMPEDSLGATALLQVFHIYNSGEMKELRSGFADAAAKLADNAAASIDDRITAICILSETAQKKHLPLIRKYATQDKSSSLKRTAIAALGERGETQDLSLIENNVNNKNYAVKLAATEALKRYRERFDGADRVAQNKVISGNK